MRVPACVFSQCKPWKGNRGDHTIGNKNTISFSMYYRHDAPDIQETGFAPKGFGFTNTYQSQHYTLSDIWTLRANLVNELRLGSTRLMSSVEARHGDYDWKELGFPFPQLSPQQWIQVAQLQPSYFSFVSNDPKYELRDAKDFRHSVLQPGESFHEMGRAPPIP